MTQKELNRIIENHQHWLRQDCEGWEFMRANLAGANLAGANLAKVNLAGADLVSADLSDSNLTYANLVEADLAEANLIHANLVGANLAHANLVEADLAEANLAYANLANANLRRTNLIRANLVCANFVNANLTRANLEKVCLMKANFIETNLRRVNFAYTNLANADFKRANLVDADLMAAFDIPMACPTEGSFVGWKKANSDTEKVIVKLLIPEDAKRSSGTDRKCRCNKAKVLSIESLNKKTQYEKATSNYDSKFIYEVGKEVSVPDFCEDRFKECAAGIHFFINREEAVRY